MMQTAVTVALTVVVMIGIQVGAVVWLMVKNECKHGKRRARE